MFETYLRCVRRPLTVVLLNVHVNVKDTQKYMGSDDYVGRTHQHFCTNRELILILVAGL